MDDTKLSYFFDEIRVSNGIHQARLQNSEYAELHSFSIPLGYDLHLVGWMVPTGPREVGVSVELAIDDEHFVEVRYGAERIDVAEYLDNPIFSKCGFRETIAYARLSLGQHVLRARMRGASGMHDVVDVLRFRVERRVANYPMLFSSKSSDVALGRMRTDIGPPCEARRIYRGCVSIVNGRLNVPGKDFSLGKIIGILDSRQTFEAVATIAGPEKGAFLLRFPTTLLRPGEHRLEIVCLSEDQRSFVRGTPWLFDVLPASSYKRPEKGKRNDSCMPAELSWANAFDGHELARASVGDVLHLRGWTVDLLTRESAGRIALTIDDVYFSHVEGGQIRADIARKFEAPKALYCGFVASIDTSPLTPGQHAVRCMLISRNLDRIHPTDATLKFVLAQSEDSSA